jgi:hypothetical protein
MNLDGYTITNIHRGKETRRHVIYAQLKDEKGELVISATFEYIYDKIREMSKETFIH